MKIFESLKIKTKEKLIANFILKEIEGRLTFLEGVGLNYLTLARSSGTLSGGEAQRIRLATQIGSALTGVLFFFKQQTAYELGLGIPAEPLFRSSRKPAVAWKDWCFP